MRLVLRTGRSSILLLSRAMVSAVLSGVAAAVAPAPLLVQIERLDDRAENLLGLHDFTFSLDQVGS